MRPSGIFTKSASRASPSSSTPATEPPSSETTGAGAGAARARRRRRRAARADWRQRPPESRRLRAPSGAEAAARSARAASPARPPRRRPRHRRALAGPRRPRRRPTPRPSAAVGRAARAPRRPRGHFAVAADVDARARAAAASGREPARGAAGGSPSRASDAAVCHERRLDACFFVMLRSRTDIECSRDARARASPRAAGLTSVEMSRSTSGVSSSSAAAMPRATASLSSTPFIVQRIPPRRVVLISRLSPAHPNTCSTICVHFRGSLVIASPWQGPGHARVTRDGGRAVPERAELCERESTTSRPCTRARLRASRMNGTRCASRKRSKLPPAARRGSRSRARARERLFVSDPSPARPLFARRRTPRSRTTRSCAGSARRRRCLSVKEPLVERL